MSFVLEVKIRIKPENIDKFMALLAYNALGARSAPAWNQFEVSVDAGSTL